jgi:O-antigen/teichoic acid export membrane protein
MARGAVLTAASRVTMTVAGAGLMLLMARVLGPAGLGDFAVAQTLVFLLLAGSTFGVEHGIVYYVSSGRWAPRAAWVASQRLALVAGALGIAVTMIVRLLVPAVLQHLSVPATMLAVGALPFQLSWWYAAYHALAGGHYDRYALPFALQALLVLVLAAAGAIIGGAVGAVAGLLLSHVLTAAVMLGRQHGLATRPASNAAAPEPSTGQPPPSSRPSMFRAAIRFGAKGYAAGALQVISLRLDLLVLGAGAAGAAVGRYSLAVSITSAVWLLPQALADVMYPRVAALSAASGADAEAARRRAEEKCLRHCVLVILVASAVGALGLLGLVVPIFGVGFTASVTLGLVLLPGCALLGFYAPLSAAVVGRGRPDLVLRSNLVVTPLTVVLYLVLIPSLHALGAALASSIAYALCFAVLAAVYRHVSGRGLLVTMAPTRAELCDYRALARAARASRTAPAQAATASAQGVTVPAQAVTASTQHAKAPAQPATTSTQAVTAPARAGGAGVASGASA